MHIIDSERFQQALRERGYRSIGALAKTLGIHRNTIHHYLSGNGVFPDGLERILEALDLSPADIIIKREPEERPLERIAPFVDALHENFPEVTFILFGSRVRRNARKYSDWDIGVYVSEGLAHERYREIVRLAEELAEELPFDIDVVNLNHADEAFLAEASRGWRFLSGRLSDWYALQRKVAS